MVIYGWYNAIADYVHRNFISVSLQEPTCSWWQPMSLAMHWDWPTLKFRLPWCIPPTSIRPRRGTSYQMMTDWEYRRSTVRADWFLQLMGILHFRNRALFLKALTKCPNETQRSLPACLCLLLSKESEQHQLKQYQILNPHQNHLQTGAAGTWFLMLRSPLREIFTSSKMGETFVHDFLI